MKQLASENLTQLAIYRANHLFSPHPNHIISDCHEALLPNEITYIAYNIFGFNVAIGSENPLLRASQKLSWSFIVTMVLSFLTILIAFDAFSGENEDKTLALTLSNAVSRGTLLFGKVLSIVSIMMILLIIGIILSSTIILAIGNIHLDTRFLVESLGFMFLSLLFISCFAVVGLLASLMTRNSNVSLLIALSFWLVFIIVIPNSALFWARRVFPVEKAAVAEHRINQEDEDISRNAPPGSWSSNSQDPFYYRHELRANLMMALMLNEKKHRDAYYADMMKQFENTRNLTMISPVALFDYSIEAFLGGGYLRFKKNWKDLHAFQEQLLVYFKEIDAADEDSPHWYNPYEWFSTTRKPVNFEEVPTYKEKLPLYGERFEFMFKYVILLIIYIGIIFSLCFIFFIKYDAR